MADVYNHYICIEIWIKKAQVMLNKEIFKMTQLRILILPKSIK